jgi:hypothetical protein
MYSSTNIIKIKLRRVRWEGQLACMGRKRNAYKILIKNLRKKGSHFEDLGVSGRLIL